MLPFYHISETLDQPWPDITESILNLTMEQNVYQHRNKIRNNPYKVINLPANIKDSVRGLFVNHFNVLGGLRVMCAVITGNIPKHSDFSRVFAYNYYIQTGGIARTSWYDTPDSDKPSCTVYFPANRWCALNTQKTHEVVFDQYTEPRVILTVTTVTGVPYRKIP